MVVPTPCLRSADEHSRILCALGAGGAQNTTAADVGVEVSSEDHQRARRDFRFGPCQRIRGARACPVALPSFRTLKPSSAPLFSYVNGSSRHRGTVAAEVAGSRRRLLGCLCAVAAADDARERRSRAPWGGRERGRDRGSPWRRSRPRGAAAGGRWAAWVAAAGMATRCIVALRGRPEPPGQDLGSASVSLRARMPRRESSVSSCQRKKKGKANVEHALIRDWNDKIVLGMS